jgi:glycosyltransferase involved in cell wall biosynthesis
MRDLSIIVCTYNPQDAVFRKCLACIMTAAKRLQSYEVIIVDNNSTVPIASREYVAALIADGVRVVVEKEQGLTPARLKGIREAQSGLLVFVDDDNFVREDFFETGLKIGQSNIHIGAYSGQVKLVFESSPPPWTRRYWGLLVHREFDKDLWSNLPHLAETMPCGAGLFVRESVAQYYLSLHENSKRNIQLDRTGGSLFSGGDNDLAACACDIGMGVGLFHELILDHYIFDSRLTKDYLVALSKGIATSAIIFKSFRNEWPKPLTSKTRIANMVRLAIMDPTSRVIYKAVLEGEDDARRMLKNLTRNFDNQ